MTFSKLAKMKFCRVHEAFKIETASETSVRILRMVKDCMIELKGRDFPVTPYIMTFGGFDVVLGLDWLSEFDAQIVYKSRLIRLKSLDGGMVTIYGDTESLGLNFILMIKVEGMLRRGCGAYLLYVIKVTTEMKEVKNFPVVYDYPEVFPEDLLGWPPERKIEFQID
ncbi:uncharacterized protein LOC143620616 [Bidens hawaiensis]|uniref:uncharacterized protein LOC143620616 n=1 Tax=Bidens hawaiensis TaxID=980011 RepID=UPI0040492070